MTSDILVCLYIFRYPCFPIYSEIFLHFHTSWDIRVCPYILRYHCISVYPHIHLHVHTSSDIPVCPYILRYHVMSTYTQISLHIHITSDIVCPYILRYPCISIYHQISLHVHISSDVPVCLYILIYTCMSTYPKSDILACPCILSPPAIVSQISLQVPTSSIRFFYIYIYPHDKNGIICAQWRAARDYSSLDQTQIPEQFFKLVKQFWNNLLRTVHGSKRDGITRHSTKLHNENLRNLWFSQNILDDQIENHRKR